MAKAARTRVVPVARTELRVDARRIERAAERGCEVVTTETGESVDGRVSSSYRNIIRAGFERAYVRPNWAAP